MLSEVLRGLLWGQSGQPPSLVETLCRIRFDGLCGSKMVVMPDSYYYHRYGHESYWARDSKKGKISLTALQIIIPYSDLLSEQDVNFIMSKNGRTTWFENLLKHPIRLHDGTRGKSGHIIGESKSDSIYEARNKGKKFRVGCVGAFANKFFPNNFLTNAKRIYWRVKSL